MKMKNDLHIKGCAYPRFETEAWGNSIMTYCDTKLRHLV